MEGNLRRAIRSREPVAGTWLSIGHPAVAEISAGLGFDFVTIDTEHAPLSTETVENMLRAVDAADGETEAVVRVAWNDPARIKRALDVGPAGIMIPMVETRADAEAAVDAIRYPPEGSRGMAAARASDYGRSFEEYVGSANENLLTIVQIESGRGVENVAEIADVDGIDALLIGPADLSASLGAFGEHDGAVVTEAVERVLDAAHAADVPVGTLTTSTDRIAWRVEQGFDFLITGVDASHLAEGSRRAREAYEDAAGRE